MDYPYDDSSRDSILNYARILLGKSLHNVYPSAERYDGGRGSLGQTVEYIHFKYRPNSAPEPDFPKAGVELKCTPLKQLLDGSMVSKERLVLNVIDYDNEAKKTFETSSFWQKNKFLLLMFYLNEQGTDILDLIFKIVRYWDLEESDLDLKIIRDDWKKLHWKMTHGLAHEISEGDTLYLGACTKGSRAGEQMRGQFIKSAPLAQQRAYSLKSKYLNTIILDSLHSEAMSNHLFLSKAQKSKIQKSIGNVSSLVEKLSDYKEDETFEELVERRFSKYYGKSIYQIEIETGVKVSSSPKAISNSVIHAILNVKTQKILEFEKANLQQKSIRLEHDGRLKESMVFSRIDYEGILEEEEWEDSILYETLTHRFLFVVFRKDASKDNKKAILEKVFFWTMPRKDLEIAEQFWVNTRENIEKEDFDHFWKLSDHNICHVRPKAKNSRDKVKTKSGKMIIKKGYWLNSDYILSVVNSNLNNPDV